MAMEMKLNFKQEMRLVPTPMLQQAIKLLQLSRLELVEAVQQEMIENPILEEILEEEEGVDQKQENPKWLKRTILMKPMDGQMTQNKNSKRQ